MTISYVKLHADPKLGKTLDIGLYHENILINKYIGLSHKINIL